MNTQATLEQMQQLKLEGMVRAYESILALPSNQHPEAHQMLAQLIQHEKDWKQTKRTRMYLRLSKLRYAALLDEVKCSKARNLTREQLTQFTDCSYLDRAENILITGATGCGKSYLSCALGHQACLHGYKVLYLNMTRFIEKLTLAKIDGSVIKLYNRIEKIPLLILDDFGLQPLEPSVRLSLLQILEDRYSKKSTIIASQLPIAKWHQYIGDSTMADAILDRLTAKFHRIELKGQSLRKQEAK